MVTPEVVIYLAVLSQTIMLTFVTTGKWVKNHLNIFRQYPPSDYPLFYIFSLRTEVIHLFVRMVLDLFVLFFIGYLLFFDAPTIETIGVFRYWVICTSIQLIPSVFSLIILRLASKLRHKRIKQKVMSFTMTHRSIFDHLSISYIFLLLLSLLLTLNIIISNEQLVLSKKIGLCVVFLITNVLLIKRIITAIYGKTNDKLISGEDQASKRNQDVQRSFVGIAASIAIFSLLGITSGSATSDSIWLIIPLSIFIQITVFHSSVRWHAEDMGVYRKSDSEK